MVDKVAIAQSALKFAVGKQAKNAKKGGKAGKTKGRKPADQPFYYEAVVLDRYGQPKLDTKGRPVTKECRKNLDYYVNQLGIPENDAKVLLKMKSRAMLMDGGRKMMGIRIPLGLSTVLTFFVPEIGDGIDGAISYLMVVRAGQISGGLGARNHAAMTLNVGRDFAIGAIPFAGAIIDMFYRANTRNSNLLEKVLIERVKKAQLQPVGSSDSSIHEVLLDEEPVVPLSKKSKSFGLHQSGRGQVLPSGTQESGVVRQSTHNDRRFDDFVGADASNTRRTATSGSKKASKSSKNHHQTELWHSTREASRVDAGPHGGRFLSSRDL